MINPEDIPLILLYTDRNSAIQGTTRFQKLVFLAQEEGDLDDFFEFSPYKYGPYSGSLQATLRSLESQGYVERSTETTSFGNERHTYSITLDGIQRVQELLGGNGVEDIFDTLQEVKKRFQDWGDRRLLRYVYNTHSEFATETELDENDLQDPHAEFELIGENIPQMDGENKNDEPTWETPEVELKSGIVYPDTVETYLAKIGDIPLVTNVYYEELEEEPNQIIAILDRRDYEVMDQLYDIELQLRTGFPNEEIRFRVTLNDAIDPVVSKSAVQVYSRN